MSSSIIWIPGIRIIRLGGRNPLPVESYCWYLPCFYRQNIEDITRWRHQLVKKTDFHPSTCPVYIFTFLSHHTRFNVFPLPQPLLSLLLLSFPLVPSSCHPCWCVWAEILPFDLLSPRNLFTSWWSSAAEAHTASSEADPFRPAGNLVQKLGNGSSRPSWPLKWHNSSWWFDYSMRDFWPGEPAKPRLDSWSAETEHGKPFSFVRSFGVICYVAIDK